MCERDILSDRDGFTMIETIIVIVVIGILAAIAAPSFLSWVRNKEVDDALALVVGALKESQSEALKLGEKCTVKIDTSLKEIRSLTSTTPPTNCLPTGRRDLRNASDNIQITTDYEFGTNDLVFTYRKTTPQGGTIVLFQPDASKSRCVVVSQGLGLIRTGFYEGDPTATLDQMDCKRNP